MCVQKAAKFLMYIAICEKLCTDKKQSTSFLISFYIFIPIVSINNHPKDHLNLVWIHNSINHSPVSFFFFFTAVLVFRDLF